MLAETELLVLNATADDIENLEQIYRMVALEFSAENYEPDNPHAYYWRERQPPILLAEIADAVKSLVRQGMLVARGAPETQANDEMCIWHSWFELTAAGRRELTESEAELSRTVLPHT